MGVYPEPALCADDVSRLAPNGSKVQRNAAAGPARIVTPNGRKALLAALAVGLALTGAPPAAAHDGLALSAGLSQAQPRSDRRTGAQPPEWGGVPLGREQPATRAIVESHPASLPEPRPDAQRLRFGEVSVPRPLVETIVRASEATGVDPVYMMALADKESSFDTDVKSSASSAQGLFQFLTGTWLEMIRDYGAKHGLVVEAAAVKCRGGAITIADEALRKRVLALRNDPYVAGLMAGELIKRDRARIESRIGRGLKTTELYLAHFLGTASAGKFLSLSAEAPDRNAQQAFGRAAKSNRSIFTQRDGGKSRSLSVAEVHERLDGMIDRRLNQYQALADFVTRDDEGFDEEHMDDAPVLDARLHLKEETVPLPAAPVVR